eukprot:gene8317-7636_t
MDMLTTMRDKVGLGSPPPLTEPPSYWDEVSDSLKLTTKQRITISALCLLMPVPVYSPSVAHPAPKPSGAYPLPAGTPSSIQ